MPEAWHLPGWQRIPPPDGSAEPPLEAEGWHRGTTAAGTAFRSPRLDAATAAGIAESVREAAMEARRERTVKDVIRACADAAARLADPNDPIGAAAAALLQSELGWSEETVAETLVGMGGYWSAEALDRVVSAELGGPGVLDAFQADSSDPSRHRRALGPPLLLLLVAGNIPGVAVTAAVRGLVVRSGVLCKLPEPEPGLMPLFGRALAERDPLLGRCLAATWWPGQLETEAWNEWVKRSHKVIVYGGDDAVQSVRSRLAVPAEIVTYGPRLGLAVVLPDAAAPGDQSEAAAVALARDVCAYEQQGCVSPRLVYVVGGELSPLAEHLAAALAAETERLAIPEPESHTALAIRSARSDYEFGEFGGPAARRMLGSADLRWSLLLQDGPGLGFETLPRVVYLYRVSDVDELLAFLRPLEGRIQAVGYAGSLSLDLLAEGAAQLGASRVSPLGSMAWPPADWRHEGRHQLLPLVSWTDLERPED